MAISYSSLEEAVAKQVNDYKIKLQKSDQEIATLQATVWHRQSYYYKIFPPNVMF